MEMMDLSQIISTVGFPIAAYIAMFWFMIHQSDAHKQEMDAVKDALAANTAALIELKSYMESRDL